jgi:hypothetical protein
VPRFCLLKHSNVRYANENRESHLSFEYTSRRLAIKIPNPLNAFLRHIAQNPNASMQRADPRLSEDKCLLFQKLHQKQFPRHMLNPPAFFSMQKCTPCVENASIAQIWPSSYCSDDSSNLFISFSNQKIPNTFFFPPNSFVFASALLIGTGSARPAAAPRIIFRRCFAFSLPCSAART